MQDIPLPILAMMVVANFYDQFGSFAERADTQELPVRGMGPITRAGWEAYVRSYTPVPSMVREDELQMAYDELVLEGEDPEEIIFVVELTQELPEDEQLPDTMLWESPTGDVIETQIRTAKVGPTGYEIYFAGSEEEFFAVTAEKEALYARREEFSEWLRERFDLEDIEGVGMSNRLSAQMLFEGRDMRIAESVIEIAERLLDEGQTLQEPTLIIFSEMFTSVEEIDSFGETRVYTAPLSAYEKI